MTRNLFLALFFLAFAACVNKDTIPAGLIAKDSMQSVLFDMIQADQYAKQYLVKDSLKINVKEERAKLYHEVFNIHHTTREQFQNSYNFYMSRPDLSKVIFDSLTSYASRKRIEVYRPHPVTKLPARATSAPVKR